MWSFPGKSQIFRKPNIKEKECMCFSISRLPPPWGLISLPALSYPRIHALCHTVGFVSAVWNCISRTPLLPKHTNVSPSFFLLSRFKE
jgi:hypothetical protein